MNMHKSLLKEKRESRVEDIAFGNRDLIHKNRDEIGKLNKAVHLIGFDLEGKPRVVTTAQVLKALLDHLKLNITYVPEESSHVEMAPWKAKK